MLAVRVHAEAEGDDGQRGHDRGGHAARALEPAEGLALVLGAGQDAHRLDAARPKREQRGEAPERVQGHELGEVQRQQMDEAAESGADQRQRQQQADADPVGQVAAEQVGDHAEHAEDAAEHADLRVGEVVGLRVGLVVIVVEVGQPIDDGAAGGHEQDGHEIASGPLAHAQLGEQVHLRSLSLRCCVGCTWWFV